MVAKAKTKTRTAKTHAAKPRTAPGRGAKAAVPAATSAKRVTMTGPGTAVAHEPVQAGEMVSHAPPTPQTLVQAGHNAGTLCGYRQALKACAENLRRQAQELRANRRTMSLSGMLAVLCDGSTERQADLLDACADAIEVQHAARASEEQSHARAAEALLAAVGAK